MNEAILRRRVKAVAGGGDGPIVGPEPYLCQRNNCTLNTNIADYQDLEFEIKFILFNNARKNLIYSAYNSNVVELVNQSDGTCTYKDYHFVVNEPYVLAKKIIKGGSYDLDYYYVNGAKISTGYTHTEIGTGTIKLSYHIYNWRSFNGGIAYLKLWHNGELIFDGVPKEVDGVCGLWDNITGQLFTNSNPDYPNDRYTIEYL